MEYGVNYAQGHGCNPIIVLVALFALAYFLEKMLVRAESKKAKNK